MQARLLSITAAALLAVSAHAAPVRVTGGLIEGKTLPDGSAIYRGIPYAAPPVGALRWKPPQAVVPWSGVRQAVEAPAPCAQLPEGDWNAADAARSGEDCLYLSLHAPRRAPGTKLPVLVWIHGGSNRAGSGYGIADSPIYQRGIVVVGVEYRLGIFGFLSMPELTASSPRKSSGNYGLLDQIAALKWVRRNIAAFGGDPGKVTIIGQSAGAIDIGQLMVSPLARGLFVRAIQESGSPGLPRTLADNERIGTQLFALNGLSPGRQGLATLRALPTATLLADSTKLRHKDNAFDALWIATVADGWVIPRDFHGFYLGWKGAAPASLLIGNNTQEFIVDDPNAALSIIKVAFGPNADRALPLYGFRGSQPPPPDPVLGSAGTQVIGDLAFRCSSNDEARWVMAGGHKVWRYQFGIPRPGSQQVLHTAELDYVFQGRPAGTSADTWPPVQQYWANFVRTGDPNGGDLPAWRAMQTDDTYMAFTPKGPRPGKALRERICKLLTDGERASWLTSQSAPPPPPGSQPDVCDMRVNPTDATLCQAARSESQPSRSSAHAAP